MTPFSRPSRARRPAALTVWSRTELAARSWPAPRRGSQQAPRPARVPGHADELGCPKTQIALANEPLQTLSTGGPERTNETVRSLHARAVYTELGSSAEKRGFPRGLFPARGLLLRLRLRLRALARPCGLPLLLLGRHLPSWSPCPLQRDSMLAGSTNSLRGSSRLARGWRAVDWAER